MNRAEEYVFEFNTLLEMNTERKYYIGNLIKFAVKTWHLRLNGKDKGPEYRQVQRKVYLAINKVRNLRQQQLRNLVEDENTDDVNENKKDSQAVQEIRDRLNQLDAKLDHLTQLINQLLHVHPQQNTPPSILRL